MASSGPRGPTGSRQPPPSYDRRASLQPAASTSASDASQRMLGAAAAKMIASQAASAQGSMAAEVDNTGGVGVMSPPLPPPAPPPTPETSPLPAGSGITPEQAAARERDRKLAKMEKKARKYAKQEQRRAERLSMAAALAADAGPTGATPAPLSTTGGVAKGIQEMAGGGVRNFSGNFSGNSSVVGGGNPDSSASSMVGGAASAVSRRPDAYSEERKQEKVARKIRELMDEVVQALTSLSRLLEKWSSTDQARMHERKETFRELIEKYSKRLRKLNGLIPLTGMHRINLPLGLVRHVDSYRSPNTWLTELYKQTVRQNRITRGELCAMGSFQATFRHCLRHGSLPAEPLTAPPLSTDVTMDNQDSLTFLTVPQDSQTSTTIPQGDAAPAVSPPL